MTARILRAVVAAALLAPLLAASQAAPAAAVSASLWDPGLIISDQLFYDGGTMNASQVQAFLEGKVPSCQPGYTCLKDYRQATPDIPADEFCDGYVGRADERASDIIAKVGYSCDISQKAILVILQKEMSLVTHTWPSSWRFDRAMGFACPDSADCDPSYSGFVYQVYYGARQFQRYAALPDRYNYRAGRSNNILYHPNTSCGYSSVYIVNKATAGLYNYTPYQPNAAALANLSGTGNSCSSYGNRNFWKFYWDWFGSPVTTNWLLRTKQSAGVYLVSGGTKYPVTNYNTYRALRPLGGVGYVSQRYLDAFETGIRVGVNFRNESGGIAMLDSGVLLPYASCDQMVDFGYVCGTDQVVQLTDDQFSSFDKGPTLTTLVGTPSGARYWVADGSKSEILDEESQTSAGIDMEMTVLSDEAVGHLALGDPIVRDDVIIRDRGRARYGLLAGGVYYPIDPATATGIGAADRSVGSLSSESVDRLDWGDAISSSLTMDAEGNVFVLTRDGRYSLPPDIADFPSPPVALPEEILSLYADLGPLPVGAFVTPATGAAVFLVTADSLRPVPSWGAVLSLAPDEGLTLLTVPRSLVDAMPRGPYVLPSGSLVRTRNSAAVYLIDGFGHRIGVHDLRLTRAAGFGNLAYTTDERLAAYEIRPERLGFGYVCGDDHYVAAGGSLHLVPPDLVPLYPFDYMPLEDVTCSHAAKGADAGLYIRSSSGAIYLLADGTKHGFTSWARWLEIGGGGWLPVSAAFADAIPTGDPA